MSNTTNRLSFISWIQFLGVLSVIFGHSMNDIAVPDFFVDIKSWVYTYHMPLFFLLSAFLLSHKGGFARKGYKATFKNRAVRLLVPYAFWNALFLVPKILLSEFTNDKITLSADYFLKIILHPRNNVLGHTWFLCGLFLMFIIAIPLEKAANKKSLYFPVTCALVVLNCVGIPSSLLAASDLAKNAIFFWAGLLLGKVDIDKIINWCKDKAFAISMTVLVLVSTVFWVIRPEVSINALVLGLAVLIWFAVIQINLNINNRFIEFVSLYSFPIYIMHWPVMMVVRAVIYTTLHVPAIPSMVIMFLCGLFIPCAVVAILRKFKFKPIQALVKLFLGI